MPADRDILCLTAPNPGPLTLGGTNTWVVGRDPAWVVDPGPAIEAHLRAVCEALDARGGLGGVVLTHDHADHAAAARELLERRAAPLAGGRGAVDVTLADGARVGPFRAVAAPGHSADSFALIAHGACFSGDAVLGAGSVFVAPHPGAMAGYMRALERLLALAGEEFDVICPGHGPLVRDAPAKLREYLDHRRARERALTDALAGGLRGQRELLDAVWADVHEQLRPAAAVTLAAHLDKLAEEGLLPAGVERACHAGVRW